MNCEVANNSQKDPGLGIIRYVFLTKNGKEEVVAWRITCLVDYISQVTVEFLE